MSTVLNYAPPSDAIRRALIRYYSSYAQVLAEYCPQFINEGVIPPSFTARDLMESFNNIGIKLTVQPLYAALQDPYSPVLDSVEENYLVSGSQIYKSNGSGGRAYYLRPRHKMLEMIEEAGYFREYEVGHSRFIPPVDVFEGEVSDEDYEFLKYLYKRLKWRRPSRSLSWHKKWLHFVDFSDDKRTALDEARIKKATEFKVGFFDALVSKGTISTWEMSYLTGVHIKNIPNMLKRCGIERESRRVFVEANSPWEALEQVDETGYAIHLSGNKYMIQLSSRLHERMDIDRSDGYSLGSVRSVKKRSMRTWNIPKNASYPGFQDRFLSKSLKKVGARLFSSRVPYEIDNIAGIIDYLRSLGHRGL